MDDQNNNPQPTPKPPATTPPASSPASTSEPAPSVSNQAVPSASPQSPVAFGTPKKKRKGLLIGSIIAGALVLLGGGGVAAYMWYQNPEKVVTDSIVNVIKAKTATYTGSLTVEGNVKLKVELTGKNDASTSDVVARVTFSLGDKEHTVESATRFDKNGDLYLKLKEIDKFVDAYKAEIPPESMDTVNKLVAKINDHWIKVSANDLAQFDESTSKKQKCIADAIKKYYQDDKLIGEVADVYKKHRFIKIDQNLGSKNGSLGYMLKADEKTAKDFFKDLKNTKIYKTVNDCDPDLKVENDQESMQQTENKATETFELWVSQWSHQITEAKATVTEKDNKSSFVGILKPKFNEKVTIETPKDSITLKQLQTEIEELWAQTQTQAEQQMLMDQGATMQQELDTSSEL